MNIATALILLALCAAVALIVRKLVRDKRSGKTCAGCSGGAGCPHCAGKK